MSAPTVQLHHGDCLDVLRTLPDNSVDAVVTDPPYNLSFMSKAWDRIDGEPIDPAFMHWLAGFIDGEGCFSVHKKPQNTYDCQFSIALRADDRPILERIHRTLGMGTLSKKTAHHTGPDNPKARWSVSKKSELVRLRDLLRAFPLRAKKATDFEVWSDALDTWVDHQRGEWDEMAELRTLLMEGRAYKDEGVRVDPFQMWCWRWGRECLRILKPGGYLLSFGGTRTSHRLASGLEDAGFELRDSIAWLYGSGFPKSLDVSKAIDKAAGAEREVVGRYVSPEGTSGASPGTAWFNEGGLSAITAPATDAARTWQGWGTALKPAHEPIVVARKPLTGTVSANVLAWGTGALNINGCRIGDADTRRNLGGLGDFGLVNDDGWVPKLGVGGSASGRWPANVVLDEGQAAVLDEQSGVTAPKAERTGRKGGSNPNPMDWDTKHTDQTGTWPGDNGGGASRFFYVAKADASERVRLPSAGGTSPNAANRRCAFCERSEITGSRCECPEPEWERETPGHVSHPTVKPLDLMRWLVRLVTPPGGTILDPFAGSGTTVEACILEGFSCIAIEREADYLPLIQQRIDRRRDPVAAVRAAGGDAGLFDLLGEEPA